MTYFYSFFILAILLLVYARFEAGNVEVKRVKFTKNKKHLKILQLSDIHIQFLKVSTKKVKKIIQLEKPDIIIITGDYIEKPKHIPEFLSFLEEIKYGKDIYICLGNHDYKAFLEDTEGLSAFIKAITSKGIFVLHNKSVCFEKNLKKYNIIGIEDIRYSRHDIVKALEFCDNDAVLNIAFTHNPDLVLEIPKGKIDYLFCGHFHGGQIWAPFGLEFKLLRNEKLCKMGIKRGLHKVNRIMLYINRGLGNVIFPLRFLSRPEITVFYIP